MSWSWIFRFFFLPIMIKSSLSHAFLAMCTDNAPGIATHLHLPYVYKGSAARCYYVIHTIASTPRVNFQTAAVWKTLILIDAARASIVSAVSKSREHVSIGSPGSFSRHEFELRTRWLQCTWIIVICARVRGDLRLVHQATLHVISCCCWRDGTYNFPPNCDGGAIDSIRGK